MMLEFLAKGSAKDLDTPSCENDPGAEFVTGKARKSCVTGDM